MLSTTLVRRQARAYLDQLLARLTTSSKVPPPYEYLYALNAEDNRTGLEIRRLPQTMQYQHLSTWHNGAEEDSRLFWLCLLSTPTAVHCGYACKRHFAQGPAWPTPEVPEHREAVSIILSPIVTKICPTVPPPNIKQSSMGASTHRMALDETRWLGNASKDRVWHSY